MIVPCSRLSPAARASSGRSPGADGSPFFSVYLTAGCSPLIRLAAAFVEHRADLWLLPGGGSSEWIEGHVDEVLAVVERLCNEASCSSHGEQIPSPDGGRLPLLAILDQGTAPLDG